MKKKNSKPDTPEYSTIKKTKHKNLSNSIIK